MPDQKACTLGLFQACSWKGIWWGCGLSPKPAGPPQAQSSPRMGLEFTQASQRPVGRRLALASRAPWRSGAVEGQLDQLWVPREVPFTPRAFLTAQNRGPVCRPGRRHVFRGTERHCVVKLMRPQGLPPGPAHAAGWHGSQDVSTTW